MIASLRPYLSILIVRYQMLLQYRAAALAGLGTQVWWGGIMIMVMAGFYMTPGARVDQLPFTLADMVTYIWLGQALFALLPYSADTEIQDMVRSGNVSYEKIRPLDTYWLWFMRSLAMRTAPPSLRALPLILFAGFFLPMIGLSDWALKPPASLEAGFLFGLSFIGVMLLAAAITTILSITVIWWLTGNGVNSIAMPIVTFFTGMVIPLPFFPDWMQPFLNAQPFRGLVDVPYRIYLGNMTGSEAFMGLAHQFVWIVILIFFGRWLMARAMSKLIVQGG